MDEIIKKVFSLSWRGHRYYVQVMPGYLGMGRDYAIMKDRKRLYGERFHNEKDATLWLLSYLSRELEAPELEMLDL